MNRLKELRLEKGMNQKETAKILGIAQPTLSGWETGRTQIDYDNLIKAADFYNVTIDYLLGRTDENQLPSAAAPAPAQDALTPSEETHIKKYRQLDDGGKEEIDDLIDVKLAKLQRKAEEGVESLG